MGNCPGKGGDSMLCKAANRAVALHALELSAPSHLRQGEPGILLYMPAGHSWQVARLGEGLVPGAHSWHVVAPASEAVPLGQALQVVAPSSSV